MFCDPLKFLIIFLAEFCTNGGLKIDFRLGFESGRHTFFSESQKPLQECAFKFLDHLNENKCIHKKTMGGPLETPTPFWSDPGS